MDSKIIELVKKWFNKTEDWQKDSFVSIWKGSNIDTIKERAYKLALKEHNIEFCAYSADVTFPKDIDKMGKDITHTALLEISDVKGVCALAPTKSLNFGLGLNIVYGENGCGKSSYVKILKKAQDPKSSINIFGNIYSEGEKTKPSANLVFDYDGIKSTDPWSLTSKKSHPIRIYDTQIAKQFVEEKNDVIYEPKLLQVFSDLAKIIEYVNVRLSEQVSIQESILTIPPESVNECSRIIEYINLKNSEEANRFKETICFSPESKKELETLTTALKDNDPQGTLKQLSARKKYLNGLFDELKNFSVKLDDSFIEKYKQHRKKQIETKAAYDDFIKKSRDVSIFKGLGSVEWVNLWKSAKSYIEYISNIDEEDKDKANNYCVLCQQELSKEALEKKQSLNEFYESKLKIEFENADNEYKNLVQEVSELIGRLNKSEIQLGLESNAIPGEVSVKVLEFVDSLYSRAKWIYEYDEDSDNPPENVDVKTITNYCESVFDEIDTKASSLDRLINDYDEQHKRFLELTAEKWLCDNQSNLAIKIKIFALNNLLSKAKTNMVTTLKKNLSQIMITEAYVERFKNELNMISSNHSINVELIQGATKGKVYHKVALVGAVEKRSTEEILSEGEYRAVSIAAFLADLSAWNVNQAFIFDDPINSLDQNYEDNIANRLVLLAGERQVIVFTHRLAFAEKLNRLAQSKNNVAKAKGTSKTEINYIKLARKPLGDPDYQNDFASYKLDSKLNSLDGPIKNSENAQKVGDHSTADMLLKGLCSTLRDIIEKSIETTLLNNIVSRYEQNISSEKIRYLKAITEADVDFINEMMTKYSKYDHSHSDEAPVPLPSIDEFKNDVKTIHNWYTEFKSRLKKYDKK